MGVVGGCEWVWKWGEGVWVGVLWIVEEGVGEGVMGVGDGGEGWVVVVDVEEEEIGDGWWVGLDVGGGEWVGRSVGVDGWLEVM